MADMDATHLSGNAGVRHAGIAEVRDLQTECGDVGDLYRFR
jgi:hypothetical protein